ncbi:hypothetical protein F5Y17DRAFT_452605 [Xylariaceae sp. FL0594]|nr:hypothetical protein F5Y17DRAFT_452605 [Xylariaceae sp. FL0594]
MCFRGEKSGLRREGAPSVRWQCLLNNGCNFMHGHRPNNDQIISIEFHNIRSVNLFLVLVGSYYIQQVAFLVLGKELLNQMWMMAHSRCTLILGTAILCLSGTEYLVLA